MSASRDRPHDREPLSLTGAPSRAQAPPAPVDRLSDLGIAAILALATLLLMRAAAGPMSDQQSVAPHFVLLADAFLHGRLWIDPVIGARLFDATPFGGRFYVAFPPMPAILMMPFVAVVGPGLNDAAFSQVLGAVNVGLAYVLVRRLSRPGFAGPGLELGRRGAAAIAALLGVGAVHFYSSLPGLVWFSAHTVAVAFLLLFLLECAGRGRPLVAGSALAAAFMARTPTVIAGVFAVLLAARRLRESRTVVPWTLRLGLPVIIGALLLFAQNAARFGSPFDFGYLHMQIDPVLEPDLRRFGPFHPHFLARNLRALLLAPPMLHSEAIAHWAGLIAHPADLVRQVGLGAPARGVAFPIDFDPWGTGLWFVSPALFTALRPPPREQAWLFTAAWAAAIAVAIPSLLYYNTGWEQFGYRFALDFIPLLLIPAAIALTPPFPRAAAIAFGVLLAASAIVNLIGARWFFRLPPY